MTKNTITARTALARYMKYHRRKARKPLRAIAPLAGMTAQRWSQLENGQGPVEPADELLERVARALGRPYEEIWFIVNRSRVPVGLRLVRARPSSKAGCGDGGILK